jgi:hypothetical protein
MVDNEMLTPDALRQHRVAVSVSESADLERLGLLEDHFRLALGEIARAALTAGGTLAYGGHLQPDGYTSFLVTELERWRETPDVIRLYLPWPVHRTTSAADLRAFETRLGLTGQSVYLDIEGNPTDPFTERDDAPQPVDPTDAAAGLTAMRHRVTEETTARILIGGKRTNFQGAIPGLLEEAISAMDAARPLFLAGGFGGVTHDIAKAFQVDDGSWLPTWPDPPAPDPRLSRALADLTALALRPDWSGLRNGLEPEENRRLAATHRPTEIAALVSLGLGRIAARRS